MTIRFYRVSCGDAARIRYPDSSGGQRNVFVDSGYERTYREILDNEIKSIVQEEEQIDLWILTHLHDDHIGGVISYIKAIARKEVTDVVANWWYNPPFIPSSPTEIESNDISEAMSFSQSESLTSYLIRVDKLTTLEITYSHDQVNIHGLKLHILSPTAQALKLLRKKYRDKDIRNIDYHLLTEISEAMAHTTNDYSRTIESFTDSESKEDDSIENGSSIALITEYANKKVLWLADTFASSIVHALKELGYSKKNPIDLDLVKVSHHGSKGNNSTDLFELIRCKKYVFCANGENKYQLPAKECISAILRNSCRPPDYHYELIFTDWTPTLGKLFKVDGEDVYERWNFKTVFPTSPLWIDIVI